MADTVDPERVFRIFRIIALILSQRCDGITVTVKEVKKISQDLKGA